MQSVDLRSNVYGVDTGPLLIVDPWGCGETVDFWEVPIQIPGADAEIRLLHVCSSANLFLAIGKSRVLKY